MGFINVCFALACWPPEYVEPFVLFVCVVSCAAVLVTNDDCSWIMRLPCGALPEQFVENIMASLGFTFLP